MAEEKPRKYKVDGLWGKTGRYVRAWTEGRGRDKEHCVQVWNSGKPEGEPQGDWGMPGVLPLNAAVEQAIAQTDK